MSDRALVPPADLVKTYRQDVDGDLDMLKQRPQGSPNGLILPGGKPGTWLPMTLINGWTALAGTIPAYTMDADGFVHTRGAVQHTVSFPTNVIWLPPTGYLSRVEEFFAVITVGASIGVSTMDMHPTLGALLLNVGATWGAGGYISFSGISYYAGAQ